MAKSGKPKESRAAKYARLNIADRPVKNWKDVDFSTGFINVEVLGVQDVIDNLMDIGASASDLRHGMSKAGAIIEKAAKKNAPVKTGNLRASIGREAYPDHVDVGTNVEYGVYQEFGTYKMKAHPFLYPALVENEDKIIEAIKDGVRENIAKRFG